MLSGAQRSRSISTGELTPAASNEAVEMLRLRCAPLSMTVHAQKLLPPAGQKLLRLQQPGRADGVRDFVVHHHCDGLGQG